MFLSLSSKINCYCLVQIQGIYNLLIYCINHHLLVTNSDRAMARPMRKQMKKACGVPLPLCGSLTPYPYPTLPYRTHLTAYQSTAFTALLCSTAGQLWFSLVNLGHGPKFKMGPGFFVLSWWRSKKDSR